MTSDGSKFSARLSRLTKVLMLVSAASFAPCTLAAMDKPIAERSLKGFKKVRTEVLNLISGAKKRVWISSAYLTDGELVSSLFIARYRNIDVQVLLGKRRSNFYMSRLNYLKKQNIPVSIQPGKFPTDWRSAVLVDNILLIIDGDLNFLKKNKVFKVRVASGKFRTKFIEAFAGATNKPIPAHAKPYPLVGRRARPKASSPGPTANAEKPSNGWRKKNQRTFERALGADGSYNYDRTSRETVAPQGVSTRLPGATIYQKK